MPRANRVRMGVYLSFTEEDKALLDELSARSGYNATALVRRFLYLYGSGNHIAGLPVLEPIPEATNALTNDR